MLPSSGAFGHSGALLHVVGPLVNISRQRFGKLHRTTGGNSECYELTFQLASVRLPRGVDVRPGRRGCWWNDDEGKVPQNQGSAVSLCSVLKLLALQLGKMDHITDPEERPADFTGQPRAAIVECG